MPSTVSDETVLIDAGVFIGAILPGDPRHSAAKPIIEAARRGDFAACTTTGLLCEVYGALTRHQALPPHSPTLAAQAVDQLVRAPSKIKVLDETVATARAAIGLAAKHGLTARRVHDARHAAVALHHGVRSVYTYDQVDWKVFEGDGMIISGP